METIRKTWEIKIDEKENANREEVLRPILTLPPERRVLGKAIKVTYAPILDEKDAQLRIAEILTEGVYSYLKANGLLVENLKKDQRIQEVLDITKGNDTQTDNEDWGESFKNRTKDKGDILY